MVNWATKDLDNHIQHNFTVSKIMNDSEFRVGIAKKWG